MHKTKKKIKITLLLSILLIGLLLFAGCADIDNNNVVNSVEYNNNSTEYGAEFDANLTEDDADSTATNNDYYLPESCYCGWDYTYAMSSIYPFNIREFIIPENIDDEFLAEFSYIHTFTYKQWDFGDYHNLVIWVDAPVRNLSFVLLSYIEDEWPEHGWPIYFDAQNILFTVDELLPTEALVLNVIFAHYLLPSAGLMFTDIDDVQRYLILHESMAGCCFPQFLLSYFEN